MGKICFIVLHYNAFDYTCKCIDSILQLEQQEQIEVVVIDNASQNDSYVQLKKKYQDAAIHFLHNDENVGFSRANNIACAYAKENFDIDFVVFTNNDVCFEQKDFVARVREEYKKSGFALLGPDVYTPRIELHVSPITREMVMPMKELKKRVLKGKIALALFPVYSWIWEKRYQKGEVEETVYDVQLEYQEQVLLSGSCMICSKDLLEEKDKIFYPETYFYYEEYILSYWCHVHNKKVVFQPSIQIIHFGGVATKTKSNNMKEKLKFWIKNDTESAIKYLQLRQGKVKESL